MRYVCYNRRIRLIRFHICIQKEMNHAKQIHHNIYFLHYYGWIHQRAQISVYAVIKRTKDRHQTELVGSPKLGRMCPHENEKNVLKAEILKGNDV